MKPPRQKIRVKKLQDSNFSPPVRNLDKKMTSDSEAEVSNNKMKK